MEGRPKIKKIPGRIQLETLAFLPNIPAGMDWSVIGFWSCRMRKTNEPIKPIKVFPIGDTGLYRVADGRHRVIAAYIAGRREIECVIVKDKTTQPG